MREPSVVDSRLIDMNVAKAHDFCAKLPGATRDLKWAFENSVHPVFSVGSKMFAMFTLVDDRLVDQLMFKADDVRFLELTDREGFSPAPYLARAKWVKVEGVERLTDTEAKVLLTDAHRVVMARLSKKMQNEIAENKGRPTKRQRKATGRAAR